MQLLRQSVRIGPVISDVYPTRDEHFLDIFPSAHAQRDRQTITF
jgi:hypothetical protein